MLCRLWLTVGCVFALYGAWHAYKMLWPEVRAWYAYAPYPGDTTVTNDERQWQILWQKGERE